MYAFEIFQEYASTAAVGVSANSLWFNRWYAL